MKHGVDALVRTGVGVLGFLVIFVAKEKKERTPGCKQREVRSPKVGGEEGMRGRGGHVVF
jgi:hypothetical protein